MLKAELSFLLWKQHSFLLFGEKLLHDTLEARHHFYVLQKSKGIGVSWKKSIICSKNSPFFCLSVLVTLQDLSGIYLHIWWLPSVWWRLQLIIEVEGGENEENERNKEYLKHQRRSCFIMALECNSGFWFFSISWQGFIMRTIVPPSLLSQSSGKGMELNCSYHKGVFPFDFKDCS